MKKIFSTIVLVVILILSFHMLSACSDGEAKEDDSGHLHVFNQEVVEREYLESKATKTSPAFYYYSCTCGEKGTETFIYGDSLENTLNIQFALTADCSYYVVNGVTGKGATLEIPYMYDGLRVIGVNAGAFKENTELYKIILPNTLEFIGAKAFQGCTNLTEINIPEESLSSIGSYAFADCVSLKNATIPAKVQELSEGVFQNCSSLKQVVLMNGLKTIGNLAFDYCTGLSAIVLPDSVTFLGNMAFRHAENLETVVFSKELSCIGNAAFQYCNNIEKVVLPNKVVSIGNSAFSYCSALKNLSVLGDVEVWGNSAFYECTKLENIYLNSAAEVNIQEKNYIFYNAGIAGDGLYITISCRAKEPLRLFKPNGIENMPKIISRVVEHNFSKYWTADDTHRYHKCLNENCNATSDKTAHDFEEWVVVKEATCITAGLRKHSCSICGKIVSESIRATEKHNFSTDWISDGTYIWQKCQTPGCATIQNKRLHHMTFAMQNNGTYYVTGYSGQDAAIIIPAKHKNVDVTGVAPGVFQGNENITSIEISSSVEDIKWSSFGGCKNLAHISVSKSNEKYKDGNSDCLIEMASKTLLLGCKNSIIPTDGSVTKIHGSAFYSANLTSIVIPDSITEIGTCAFQNCTNLKTIVFGAKSQLSKIDASAFKGCTNLTKVVLPTNVTSLGNEVFRDCTGLANVVFSSKIVQAGVNLFKNCTSLVYNEYDNAYYLGSSNNPYFYLVQAKNTNIASCNIHEKTVLVGADSFYNCSVLESIELHGSIIAIGENAFRDCVSLKTVSFATNSCLQIIGGHAFYNCSNITAITIPTDVTIIESSAFGTCTKLKKVTFESNNKLFEIGAFAFSQCEALTSIEIPKAVNSIGSFAFSYCTSLKSVNFSTDSSLQTILSAAFLECTALTRIVIPAQVNKIGKGAFSDCRNLASATFEIKTGWTIEGVGLLSSTSLSNTSTAAKYLRMNGYYCEYTWERK